MKIKDVVFESSGDKIFEIEKAGYTGNFIIKLTFNDGSEKSINFKPFLMNSRHPAIKKYLNEKLFKDFAIIDGNLNWNDYDLLFPIADLYDGTIN